MHKRAMAGDAIKPYFGEIRIRLEDTRQKYLNPILRHLGSKADANGFPGWLSSCSYTMTFGRDYVSYTSPSPVMQALFCALLNLHSYSPRKVEPVDACGKYIAIT